MLSLDFNDLYEPGLSPFELLDTKTANLETYGEDDRASQVSDEQQESTQEATGNPLNRRKVRRCFRAEQLEYLERCFMEAIYPEASMRKRIAQELKVSNDRVQVGLYLTA